MPSTYRDHNAVMEVVLCCFHGGTLASGHERATVGDIIDVRRPLGRIGTKECDQFLWIKLTCFGDIDELWQLSQPHTEQDPEGPTFEKRRFCIPLDRLKQVYPSLDIARVRDTADKYQPFLGYDEEGAFLIFNHSPLQIEGLVFDKTTGKFL
jgi:hypothetical protein